MPDPESDERVILDIEALEGNHTLALLGVKLATLQGALTTRQFVVVGEKITSHLSRDKSEAGRNSLLMHIYALAFDWCVSVINESIARPKSEVSHTVGVLDIFGFENFNENKNQTNSFPQLCINLTNERLHGLFIRHVFEVEQEEYKREGIEWTVVDYHDNKDIIALITKRPAGIFATIDSAGMTEDKDQDAKDKDPHAKDKALLQNLHATFDKAPFNKGEYRVYGRPKKANCFTVYHYAGAVEYGIIGFVERV